MSTPNIHFSIDIKKKITLNYSKSVFFSMGLDSSGERAISVQAIDRSSTVCGNPISNAEAVEDEIGNCT